MKSYAIADLEGPPDEQFFARVAALAEAGVEMIQLRGKSFEARALLEVAGHMRAITAGKSSFLVNGRTDIAIAAGADGVHLPARGLPVEMVRSIGKHLLIGRSCHSRTEVKVAAAAGCDYVLFGPLFDTRSKPGSASISRSDLIAAAAESCDVYALGGLSLENLHEVAGSGIAGIAGITLFMRDKPVAKIVEAIRAI